MGGARPLQLPRGLGGDVDGEPGPTASCLDRPYRHRPRLGQGGYPPRSSRGTVGDTCARPNGGGAMTKRGNARSGELSRVVSGSLIKQKSKRVTFLTEAQVPRIEPAQPVRRPAAIARMLALAHHIQRALERGLVRNRATVARRLGLTEARVTQIMNLLYLAPDIQLRVLELEAVDGVEPTNEKAMRRAAITVRWSEQSNF